MISDFEYKIYKSNSPLRYHSKTPEEIRKQIRAEAVYDAMAFLMDNIKIKEEKDKKGTTFSLYFVITDKNITRKESDKNG